MRRNDNRRSSREATRDLNCKSNRQPWEMNLKILLLTPNGPSRTSPSILFHLLEVMNRPRLAEARSGSVIADVGLQCFRSGADMDNGRDPR